jgi:hypothetical protein
MKTRSQVMLGIAALAAAGGSVFADAGTPNDPRAPIEAHDDIRQATNTLLRPDSARMAERQKRQQQAPIASAPTPGTVVMSPYVLREPEERDVLLPRYETPAMRFLKEGTLYSHMGQKYSTRLLVRPYTKAEHTGGTDAPANGIQLAFTLAW